MSLPNTREQIRVALHRAEVLTIRASASKRHTGTTRSLNIYDVLTSRPGEAGNSKLNHAIYALVRIQPYRQALLVPYRST